MGGENQRNQCWLLAYHDDDILIKVNFRFNCKHTKHEEHVYIKYNLIFIFFNSDICVFAHTKKLLGDWTASGKPNFCQNSRPYIVLKLPRDPHGHTSSPTPYFSLPWLTPMQCMFSIGYGLHPCIFFLPQISRPRIACFSSTQLILSMTRCICQLHPLASPLVKAIYYTN